MRIEKGLNQSTIGRIILQLPPSFCYFMLQTKTPVRPTLKIFLFPLTRPCFSRAAMGRSVGKSFLLISEISLYLLNLIVNSSENSN